MIRLIGIPAALIGKKLTPRLQAIPSTPTVWFVWDTPAPYEAAKRLSAFLSETYALPNRLLFPHQRPVTYAILDSWLRELPHAVWSATLPALIHLVPSYRLTFLLPNEKHPLLPIGLDAHTWEKFERAYDLPQQIRPLKAFLPFEAVGRL